LHRPDISAKNLLLITLFPYVLKLLLFLHRRSVLSVSHKLEYYADTAKGIYNTTTINDHYVVIEVVKYEYEGVT